MCVDDRVKMELTAIIEISNSTGKSHLLHYTQNIRPYENLLNTFLTYR